MMDNTMFAVKLITRSLFVLCQVIAVLFLVSGCASSRPKLVDADAVPLYGVDPMYHTVYIGSDGQYHYFGWNRGLRSGQVKVDKAHLKLSREFARGTSTAFVEKTRDGMVDVMILTNPSGEPDGPANGGQLIYSETNRTSSAAGSRR
jgi:hypothetical protein